MEDSIVNIFFGEKEELVKAPSTMKKKSLCLNLQ